MGIGIVAPRLGTGIARLILAAGTSSGAEQEDSAGLLAFQSLVPLADAVEAIGRHVKCPLVDLDFQPGDEQLRPGPML